MTKLAIITTHPIQYYAPIFRMLAGSSSLELKVFYTRGKQENNFDKGFGKQIEWDIPLLEGYEYTFLKNTAKDPGSHHFRGIVNPDLVQEVKQWGANSLLVFGWSNYSHLKAMCYFKGKIPVFFRGDSHLLDDAPLWKKVLRKIFLSWVYSHVDTVFYVGTQNKAYFLEYGLKEGQLIFAPHAIDNDRFSDRNDKYEEEASSWKKNLNIKENQKVILFCGKFEHKKNPLILLNVANKMQNNQDFVFLFIGNGHLEEKIKSRAKGMENVRFLDFQNQSCMPIVYRLGDIFVLPSQGPGETWGLAVNEAMACRKAVIVSDKVGCAVDLVKNGENGYIFKSNSLSDVHHKLILLLNDKSKVNEMGKSSNTIINDWNFIRIKETIERHLMSLN